MRLNRPSFLLLTIDSGPFLLVSSCFFFRTYNLPVRISFDLDGVLADMDAALARIAEQEFGVTPTSAPADSRSGSRSGGAEASPTPGGLKPSGYDDDRSGGHERSGGEATDAAGDLAGHAVGNAAANAAGRSAGEKAGDSDGGDAQPAYDTTLLNSLTARQQSRLWQRVRDTRNFWETLDECEPGTVRRLQKIAHELRWDVLFVTQRPGTAGRTQQLQTQHWLKRRGFEYPAVYTTIGSRGAIAAALTLDAHIDDRLQHCVDVATESKAWPILVWREPESHNRVRSGGVNLGIAVVRSLAEALDRIEQADRADGRGDKADARRAEAPRLLLDRLRRAFR